MSMQRQPYRTFYALPSNGEHWSNDRRGGSRHQESFLAWMRPKDILVNSTTAGLYSDMKTYV